MSSEERASYIGQLSITRVIESVQFAHLLLCARAQHHWPLVRRWLVVECLDVVTLLDDVVVIIHEVDQGMSRGASCPVAVPESGLQTVRRLLQQSRNEIS